MRFFVLRVNDWRKRNGVEMEGGIGEVCLISECFVTFLSKSFLTVAEAQWEDSKLQVSRLKAQQR